MRVRLLFCTARYEYEYQLRVGRQRQVWFIPLTDCDPLRTRAIPERLRSVITTRQIHVYLTLLINLLSKPSA